MTFLITRRFEKQKPAGVMFNIYTYINIWLAVAVAGCGTESRCGKPSAVFPQARGPSRAAKLLRRA